MAYVYIVRHMPIMKNKEWKVGLSMLMILGITTFYYVEFSSEPIEDIELIDFVELHSAASFVPPQIDIEPFEEALLKHSHGDSAIDELGIKKPILDAKADLGSGIVRIYIPGGFVPQENPNRRLMKTRFNIDFGQEGCIRIHNQKDLIAYNSIVFAYLDKKFGNNWRQFLTVDTY